MAEGEGWQVALEECEPGAVKNRGMEQGDWRGKCKNQSSRIGRHFSRGIWGLESNSGYTDRRRVAGAFPYSVIP